LPFLTLCPAGFVQSQFLLLVAIVNICFWHFSFPLKTSQTPIRTPKCLIQEFKRLWPNPL
jgi:hypothetical protein